jgi:sterol desaturase/sphingolipid hydroxylase (fatty acid hydroxylase superfamily)
MLEKLVHYFDAIPSLHRALIIAGGITFFWLIESAVPLFRFSYNKWKHASLNIFFTLTTIVVNFAFAYLIVLTSIWCKENSFGVLYWTNLSLGWQLLIGLLLLDLISAYLIHFIEHKIKWMWKFHIIHHADTYVDTTTANRHHPGESVFRAVFTLLAVFVTGAPLWLIMLYQSLSAFLSQFNHANISLPAWLDKSISWVIVSPDMHKVHHHFVRPETDSNYGNIFSIWDRLFGTFRYTPVKNLKFGLDVLEGRRVDEISSQLKIPFDKTIKTDY